MDTSDREWRDYMDAKKKKFGQALRRVYWSEDYQDAMATRLHGRRRDGSFADVSIRAAIFDMIFIRLAKR